MALKVGAAQLRWVTDFSEASWLEGEHGDFSRRGHLRCANGSIPPWLVTLTLVFTRIAEVVADTYALVQII